jgi:hypothetical protein
VPNDSITVVERLRDNVGRHQSPLRARTLARLILILGVLAVIPAFFLPGTYPIDPRLEPRVWYVVGGDWLGIGLALIALSILVGALARRFESRRPS